MAERPDARCPQCAALVRTGDLWCGQCLADLRDPAELAAAASDPEPASAEVAERPRGRGRHAKPAEGPPLSRLLADVTAGVSAMATPAPPVASTAHPDEIPQEEWEAALAVAPLARVAGSRPDVAADSDSEPTDVAETPDPEQSVAVMLSLLAAGNDSGVSEWSQRLSTPSAKLGLVIGGGVGLMVALLLGLSLLGSIVG